MSGTTSERSIVSGRNLPVRSSTSPHPEELRAADVVLEVVRDEPRQLGLRAQVLERRREVRRARLAEHDRLVVARVLEARHERARVEHRTALRLPPAVLVQAVELRTVLELENARLRFM